VRIILIGGFAGIDKKNALFSVGNELITRAPKVAVVNIEDVENNEKSPVNMHSDITVKEMQNIPCTFISELIPKLHEINKRSAFDYIVIEIPFSLPPGRVKEALVNIQINDLSFAPTIYVFDVNNLKSDAKMIPKIVSKQIIGSELIFANANPNDYETIASLNSIFKEINPHAKIFVYATDSKGHGINDFVDMIIN
jgi:G3E family GTPase